MAIEKTPNISHISRSTQLAPENIEVNENVKKFFKGETK